MTIRNVHLIGLGAIGGMYASWLHESDPSLVTVVADAQRRRRYAANGFAINGRPYEFTYRDPADGGPPADLVIVGVKQHHLEQTIRDIAGSVGEETTILSLLNGITSEEIIGEAYGIDKLLYSFCVGTDAVRESGGITFTRVGTIVFGERTNTAHSPRVLAVSELFDRTGIPYRVPSDMMRELWWKFMMNVGINPVSAILRAPYGAFQRLAEARELFTLAAREAIALAQAAGVGLAEADIDACFEIFDTLSPEGRTSMFQDVEAQRKTEIDLFAGTVVALGRRYGIPTPVNEVLLGMVRTLEKSYPAL